MALRLAGTGLAGRLVTWLRWWLLQLQRTLAFGFLRGDDSLGEQS
jgi:hypothetical protein